MIRLPKDIMTHILSYCNEPLTLYKNTHREQWRRIRVERVRHLLWGVDGDYDSDADDVEVAFLAGADVMIATVDDEPWPWAWDYSKVAVELDCTDEFSGLDSNEDWPTRGYDTEYDEEDDLQYEYAVEFQGNLSYKQWKDYNKFMTYCAEDPLHFVRTLFFEF